MLKFTFPKKLRLLKSSDYVVVFNNHKRIQLLQFVLLSKLNTLKHPRIGLSIAKKYTKKSHDRNKIKRLTRESFRIHQYKLPAMDFILIVKENIAEFNHFNLLENLNKLWHFYL